MGEVGTSGKESQGFLGSRKPGTPKCRCSRRAEVPEEVVVYAPERRAEPAGLVLNP